MLRPLGNDRDAHSLHSNHYMRLSPGHPLVVDLDEERVSIPSSPLSTLLEPEVFSSEALEESAMMIPPLGDTCTLGNQ